MYGGQSSYIPFKINVSGVMPVIFAGAVLNIPVFISSMLAQKFAFFKWVLAGFHPMGPAYNGMLFCLIILFSFFYTAFVFNPEELAENIKKSGGFVPGIRPGKRTAEFFNYILMRLGLAGAIYLGVLALLPSILALFVDMPFYLSGTGLLIVVGVALELFSQIETFLVEHRYQGFLDSGRFKYRGRR
ncbi:MAG: SecY family transport protein [Candidatus Babeliales bacterium]